ncbi:ABC transporter substrate-binding protein [Bacillus sp. J14TS2]|uniref:extracellular solute-binding protein n=1 Tax=Bacillus sp. J14TS2 TaxID=2807188 RepID=UPI001B09DA15|nr:extracellular solute-binding protein [Bacillus sp. J14TS2]GIN70030.1 ABC transporter substrate-binding protein [Bacillus sp. J14TS2]
MRKSFMFIVGVLILFLVAACSSSKETESANTKAERTENLNKTGMPIVEDKISLDFFAGQAPQSAPNWNDVMLFNEYEKMTNIDIEWEMVPKTGLTEKRNLRLASDNLPDAFHSASVPENDILKYGQQGVFIPLNDLIDEYAPNLKKIFEEYPEIEKGITFPDGNIYSFPLLTEPDFLSSRLGSVPWINQEWLEKLDMDMPKTTEEFYQYLKAVQEKDPGGNNGIPYGSGNIGEMVNWLKGAFGIENMGSANPNIDVDPEDGEALRFYPISEGYKELLQYINKLYEEKLIEQNIFSIDTNQFLANGSDGLYGSTNWFGPIETFGEEGGKPFVGIPALEGPHGDKMITKMNPSVNTVGAFLITRENQYPEATVRWIDHFYGKEGIELFYLGIEGETFEEKADGTVDFIDEINNHPDGLSFEEAVTEYLTFPGGGSPTMTIQEFYRGGGSSEKRLATAELLKPDVVKDPWSSFIYTEEETKILDSTGNDIEKYVDEMRDKFLSGQVSFDEWDQYVQTIEGLGLEEYMQVKEEAYKRQKSQ